MRRRRMFFEIQVESQTSLAETRKYIEAAIQMWSKGGSPESALWDLKVLSVNRGSASDILSEDESYE